MSTTGPAPADGAAAAAEFRARAALALAFFESLHRDRTQLVQLDEAMRRALMEVAGRVTRPDSLQKRAFVRALRKQQLAEKRAADAARLATTGIRRARSEAVFTTPPVLPAPLAAGADIDSALEAP